MVSCNVHSIRVGVLGRNIKVVTMIIYSLVHDGILSHHYV
jgi:hypothetical protein